MRVFHLLAVILFVLVLQSCSRSAMDWRAEQPYRPSPDPEIGDILHTATGHFVSREEFYSSLAYYPLIYVGEVHDNPASHRWQLDILKAMNRRYPGSMSLGMEMFNNEQQPVLDRWVAGELSEKEFLRESRWYEVWGSDFALYRDLLEYCRDQKIPLVGLNASKKLGRKVSMTELDKLDAETRQQMPEMDMTDPYQRQMVRQIFGAHGAGVTMLESFLRRQTLWDETMAASVAGYLERNEDRRMVVLAGGWHINYGFGIPRRVHRRLPLPYVLVGGHNLEVPEEKQSQLMDVELAPFPMRAVDYLIYQAYEVFRGGGVRLGVGLEDSDGAPGLLVTTVLADSVAQKAGIDTGDRLLRFGDVELNDNFDLVYAVRQLSPDTAVDIELKRDGELLRVTVNF